MDILMCALCFLVMIKFGNEIFSIINWVAAKIWSQLKLKYRYLLVESFFYLLFLQQSTRSVFNVTDSLQVFPDNNY